jgi:hypothetical protein
MGLKKLIAALVIAGVLGTGIVQPRPAHADDTAIIVVASIAAWVAFLVIGTYFVYGRDDDEESLLPRDIPVQSRSPDDSFRVGSGCLRASEGHMNAICW